MRETFKYCIASGVGGFHVFTFNRLGATARCQFGPFDTRVEAIDYVSKWALIYGYENAEEVTN